MRSQYVITASYFHPLTKILSTLFLGFTPLYKLEAGYTWGMVGLLALAFYLEGEKRESLRAGVTFGVISFGGNLLLERGPVFLLPLTSFLLIVQVCCIFHSCRLSGWSKRRMWEVYWQLWIRSGCPRR